MCQLGLELARRRQWAFPPRCWLLERSLSPLERTSCRPGPRGCHANKMAPRRLHFILFRHLNHEHHSIQFWVWDYEFSNGGQQIIPFIPNKSSTIGSRFQGKLEIFDKKLAYWDDPSRSCANQLRAETCPKSENKKTNIFFIKIPRSILNYLAARSWFFMDKKTHHESTINPVGLGPGRSGRALVQSLQPISLRRGSSGGSLKLLLFF